MLESLISFLETELSVSSQSIKLAKNKHSQNWTLFPIILFQYGLINISELDIIWDWIESQSEL